MAPKPGDRQAFLPFITPRNCTFATAILREFGVVGLRAIPSVEAGGAASIMFLSGQGTPSPLLPQLSFACFGCRCTVFIVIIIIALGPCKCRYSARGGRPICTQALDSSVLGLYGVQ